MATKTTKTTTTAKAQPKATTNAAADKLADKLAALPLVKAVQAEAGKPAGRWRTLADIGKRLNVTAHHATVRPLDEIEYTRLFNDIKARGVQSPLVVTKSGSLIDGHHRLLIASTLGVDPATLPVHVTGAATAAEVSELAVTLNAARRQMTREEIAAFAIASIKSGKSTRQVAKDAGVSKSTVANIAKAAGVSGPDTVTGTDGRKRAANRKSNAKAGKAAARQRATTAGKAKSPDDLVKAAKAAISKVPGDRLMEIMAHVAACAASGGDTA